MLDRQALRDARLAQDCIDGGLRSSLPSTAAWRSVGSGVHTVSADSQFDTCSQATGTVKGCGTPSGSLQFAGTRAGLPTAIRPELPHSVSRPANRGSCRAGRLRNCRRKSGCWRRQESPEAFAFEVCEGLRHVCPTFTRGLPISKARVRNDLRLCGAPFMS